MPRPLRFTGENPPLDLWTEFPNWRNAYDEEGIPGQDETTLKPDEDQTSVSKNTSFTTGKVRFRDGREFPAFLAISNNRIDGCDVYETSEPWRIYYSYPDKRWLPFLAEWLPAAERPPAISFENDSVFPLIIEMVIPWTAGAKPSVYEVSTDGIQQELVE
jgi:hypothetical protein